MIHIGWVAIAELALARAVEHARYDWIFRLDPDEVVDPSLAPLIRDALNGSSESVCGYLVPFRVLFPRQEIDSVPLGVVGST